jgi:hypothetical protein
MEECHAGSDQETRREGGHRQRHHCHRVVSVHGNTVRIGVEAPDQVRILRAELACWPEDPAACEEPADPACPCGEEGV